jgi:hypothetical protein
MQSAARGRWSVARRSAACALVAYHLGAVTIANLAESTDLTRSMHKLVDPYLHFFGQWQEWDMFTTIPLYLSLQGKVVARATDGKETRYEPMLPGLAPQADSLRLASMFARVVWARRSFAWHVDRYRDAVCAAVGQQQGETPRSVRVELDAMVIRNLKLIRQDGVIAEPKTFKSEDLPCPH